MPKFVDLLKWHRHLACEYKPKLRASASLREIKFSSTVEPKLPDVPEFQIQFI